MPLSGIPTVSLFCGAGGLDWGFRRESFQIVLACDNSRPAIESYNLNTKKKVARLVDLSSVGADEIRSLLTEAAAGVQPLGVIGGPPCQGFSRGNASADPSDPRNLLPFKYAQILSELNRGNALRFFVFENVMGLLTPRHAKRFQAIIREFEGAGFKVWHRDLNASAFGVAQNRRRLFVVGLNATLYPDVEFRFPKGAKVEKSVRDAISGLPAPVFNARGLTRKDIPYHPNHWTSVPVSVKLCGLSPTDGRSFRRLDWDEMSPTVAYGNREIHVHPDGGRRLTIHEAMLLQGFPPTYRLAGNFSEQVTQVSNAVPPPVARALARAVRRSVELDRA
jgi:DNA (cytosine-5)-methyltransferase 1